MSLSKDSYDRQMKRVNRRYAFYLKQLSKCSDSERITCNAILKDIADYIDYLQSQNSYPAAFDYALYQKLYQKHFSTHKSAHKLSELIDQTIKRMDPIGPDSKQKKPSYRIKFKNRGKL